MPLLHPGRLFPADASIRAIALTLYDRVADLPIVSPHGHTDPAWFAENGRFADPASLLLTPDHYVLRMLRSQGVSYDDLGVPRKDGSVTAPPPPRAAWRVLCANWRMFEGTPSSLWVQHSLASFFDIHERLGVDNADCAVRQS